jgi:predicted CXXCH cytochrome family protein
MKRILAGVLMVAFAATMAAAADTVTMKAKNGDVTFNHKAHSASGDCKACHGEATPAKLTLGKDAAHKLCKGCHEAKKQGPVKCGECHKK